MYNKVLLIILLLSLSCPFTSYAKSKTSRDVPGTAIFVMAEKPLIPIETRKIQIERPELSLRLEIPQLRGLQQKKFEKELNKSFLEEAQKIQKTAIQTAEMYNKDLLKDGLPPVKFEVVKNYSVKEAPSPYLVLSLFDYQYSGGAHGISYQNYLVIDTALGKKVALKDLFKENTNYISVINGEIKKQMQEREAQGAYFFSGAEGFVSISEHQIFYLNKQGDVVIVFNIYEIAPYAAGIVEFTIPKAILSPYLKEAA
ncbi:hypothetical protein CS063_09010 [Sporanaerobium hydrogeniformans]|uniref:Uncharacterized protein n=1 Tax=Sporanaerobium hydrogeniformans TaxID=3072179 RepID=A0AC61DD47_9FIRM|nr:DUF3298 and DUF4163 domain-containing protein [Sporanaerobium hydrogeniformans]PHV70661.1 hypothetical protein CS063_09010 [Sporanaerobium hydrogeniformans]